MAVESIRRLLKSNLGIMMLSSGIWRIGFSMTMPFWALYVVHLGGNYVHVGLISTVGSAMGLIPSLLGGYFADAYGRKKMVYISSVILALTQSLYFLAPSWEWLLVAQSINAIFGGLRHPAFSALIADSTDSDSRALGFGMWQSLPQVFGLFSPYLIGLLMDNYGIITAQRWAYMTSLSMGLIGAYMRGKYLEETISVQEERLSVVSILKNSFSDFRDTYSSISRQIWVMIIIGGLFQFGASTAVMFMVTYATEDVILLSAAQWGLINTASQIVSMLITLPISMLIDRYGRIKPVIFSLLTTPILIGGFLLSRNFTWTFTFYIFLTIIGIVGGVAGQALFVDYSPKQHRGRIYGLTNFIGATQSFNTQMIGGFTIIGAVASIIGGTLYQNISYASPFILMASIIGFSGVFGLIFLREPEKRET